MPPKKKEQPKPTKVAVDKTFGLKNVTSISSMLPIFELIIWLEKQIKESPTICSTGSTTAGRDRNQC
jgi:hypothetical protein